MKGEGYYMGAWRLSVLFLLLFAGVYVTLTRGGAGSAGAAPANMTPFNGGLFEASGVAHVPGTNGVLFVDDGRHDDVFWMQLGADGAQAGAIRPVKLGVSVIDLEGITFDGNYFYVVGSQSKSKGGDLNGLVRFRFDAERQRAEGTEAVSGLKAFLAANVAELRGMEKRKYKDGGINIEGIAWEPKGGRLLLGLRSPIVDGQALVVPLRLRDPRAALTAANLEVEGGRAIRLPFGGAGIRSIEYDGRVNAFRVITGAGPNDERLDFKLWEWDGNAERPGLRELSSFDRKLKPEGVTRVATGTRDFGFIVFDTGGYTAAE